MTEPDTKETQAERNERDRRERMRLARRTMAELADILSNRRGIERLRAITDDEWAAAAAGDEDAA